MNCILINGIETISHQKNFLQKFKPALEGVIGVAYPSLCLPLSPADVSL